MMSTKTSVSANLQTVVDETLSNGFTYLNPIAIREILAEFPGALQVDVANRDPQGNVVVRATSDGINAAYGGHEDATTTETHVAAPVGKSRFKIEDGVPVPPPRRGIAMEPRYPFNLLNKGQSFFVPATKERPNPAKALASTVSSANKRMASAGKRFIIRPEAGGARIWRIE